MSTRLLLHKIHSNFFLQFNSQFPHNRHFERSFQHLLPNWISYYLLINILFKTWTVSSWTKCACNSRILFDFSLWISHMNAKNEREQLKTVHENSVMVNTTKVGWGIVDRTYTLSPPLRVLCPKKGFQRANARVIVYTRTRSPTHTFTCNLINCFDGWNICSRNYFVGVIKCLKFAYLLCVRVQGLSLPSALNQSQMHTFHYKTEMNLLFRMHHAHCPSRRFLFFIFSKSKKFS